MAFDGAVERNNIYTKLLTLAGGRVHRGIPDDEMLERFANGKVKPYIIVMFGRPIPRLRDRGMGVGERGQPYIMAVSVIAFAASQTDTEATAAAVTDLLLGWNPNPGNATELAGGGGYAFNAIDAESKPSQFKEATQFEVGS